MALADDNFDNNFDNNSSNNFENKLAGNCDDCRIRSSKRIAWAVTGCGDRLFETYELMLALREKYDLDVDLFLSKEGLVVVKWYKLWDRIRADFPGVKVSNGPNSPFILGELQMGKYDFLLVSPASANTVAKIVCGIADTFVTNTVAQTAKSETPVYIFPVDQVRGKITTEAPDGRVFQLKMREVDVSNSEKLAGMENITVLGSEKEIRDIMRIHGY